MALPPSATTMRLSFWVMTLHSVGAGTAADPHRDDTLVGHGRRPAPRRPDVRRRPRDRLPPQRGGRGHRARPHAAADARPAAPAGAGDDRPPPAPERPHLALALLEALGRRRGTPARTCDACRHRAGRLAGGRPLTRAGIVATGTLAYAISDVVKVGTYAAIGWVTPPLLLATVAATPLLYLGSWLGYRLNARLPRRAFALTLVAIALAGALRL